MAKTNPAPPAPLMEVPHSLGCEEYVIGNLMRHDSPVAFQDIAAIVTSTDFYYRRFQILWTLFQWLDSHGKGTRYSMVIEGLRVTGELDDVGGEVYLAKLADDAHGVHVAEHAQVIQEHSLKRQFLACNGASAKKIHEGEPLAVVMSEQSQALATLNSAPTETTRLSSKDVLQTVIAEIESNFNGQVKNLGYTVDMPQVDEVLDGFQPERYYVLGGKPGTGKTALAIQWATSLARDYPNEILFATLEISDRELMVRALAHLARIDHRKMKKGQLEEEEWTRMTAALAQLNESPFQILYEPGLSVASLEAAARHQQAESGLKVLIVDYAQLLTIEGTFENRQREVSAISTALARLSRHLQCAVLALASLKRYEGNRRPRQDDFLDSGSFERDSDCCLQLHDPYAIDVPDGIQVTGQNAEKELLLLCPKHRMGPKDVDMRLRFHPTLQRFEDPTADWGNQPQPYGLVGDGLNRFQTKGQQRR